MNERANPPTPPKLVAENAIERGETEARVRCGLTPDDPSSVREDDVVGLEAFADD